MLENDYVLDSKYALTVTEVQNLAAAFTQDSSAKVAQNAVTKTNVLDVAINRQRILELNLTTEIKLDNLPITDQKKSGRCWIFAATNVFRIPVAEKLKLEEFKFSETYVHFYDKLEKANLFLAAMIQYADHPLQDRIVKRFLENPIGDGGDWPFFVNIVKKYGLVPDYAFPNTESSENTDAMNMILELVLRRGAAKIRAEIAAGGDGTKAKTTALADVYRVLSVHLGTPPKEFIFQYRDKDQKFHRVGKFTPLEFAAKYLPKDFDEYLVLAHDPRTNIKLYQNYSLAYCGDVIEAPMLSYVTVTSEDLKAAAIASLQNKEAVWFTCDVAQQRNNELGLWAADLYDYEALYGIELDWSKSMKMDYYEVAPTHAMALVGVDFTEYTNANNPIPIAWRVENSWGEDCGAKGYYTMADSWFDEYVISIAVPWRSLNPELREKVASAKAQKPMILAPWEGLYDSRKY